MDANYGIEVFIEKDCLDKLNKDFLNESHSLWQRKLFELLQYEELRFCCNLDFDTANKRDLENYKINNYLFSKILNYSSPINYGTVNDFILKSNYKQTLVIESKENHINRGKVEDKGGLYFTYDDYQKKIEDIISYYQQKIDLSIEFCGWDKVLNKTILKINEIIINDNFLINEKKNIDLFIIPLLKSVKKQNTLAQIIFTMDYNKKKDYINYDEMIKEIIEKLNNFKNIEIKFLKFKKITNHDRILYTNFFIIDCPIGFNKINDVSNSVITIDTIFDKFAYNRRRRHLKSYFN